MQGLEVPLMVLQSKVFLIAALRDFSPLVSRRKTFIRRVKHAVNDVRCSITGISGSSSNDARLIAAAECSEVSSDGGNLTDGEGRVPSESSVEEGAAAKPVSQSDAMRFFTKIPFPEPKRVIRLRPRTLA